MSVKQSIPTFVRGTAIKIVDIIDVATATSVKITIKDPTKSSKVSSVSMTKDADKVYSYIWQSTTSDLEGNYIVTIISVYNGYSNVKEGLFILEKQEGEL